MKKSYKWQKEQFLISSKGKLIGWGVDDVKNLIKNANRAKKEDLKSKQQITLAEAECLLAYEWFEMLLEKGKFKITEEVVRKLNSRIAHVRYHHILMNTPQGNPYWRRIANGDQIDDPELSVAYGVAHLLAVGAFSGLKRCRTPSCQKFFIGRPDAKSCSDLCGSKYRTARIRKKNRIQKIY